MDSFLINMRDQRQDKYICFFSQLSESLKNLKNPLSLVYTQKDKIWDFSDELKIAINQLLGKS